MAEERFDGRSILYQFLNCSLQDQNDDQDLNRDLIAMLISRLGIWFPTSSYKILPIALPHVVRDPNCRPNRRGGESTDDEWGSPNEDGYVRDDNSLIKGLTRYLDIEPVSFAGYAKKRMGPGFVAAHVWQKTRHGSRSTRNPITNSFWPNLVWLPADLAKLTDREDSFAEKFVQTIAWKLYRRVEVHEDLQQYCEAGWDILPTGEQLAGDDAVERRLPRLEELNVFNVTQSFISRRLTRIDRVATALECTRSGILPEHIKLRPSRYRHGLPELQWTKVTDLHNYLLGYSAAITAARQI